MYVSSCTRTITTTDNTSTSLPALPVMHTEYIHTILVQYEERYYLYLQIVTFFSVPNNWYCSSSWRFLEKKLYIYIMFFPGQNNPGFPRTIHLFSTNLNLYSHMLYFTEVSYIKPCMFFTEKIDQRNKIILGLPGNTGIAWSQIHRTEYLYIHDLYSYTTYSTDIP